MPDILISAIAWQACYTNTCLHVFTIYNSSIKYIQTRCRLYYRNKNDYRSWCYYYVACITTTLYTV